MANHKKSDFHINKQPSTITTIEINYDETQTNLEEAWHNLLSTSTADQETDQKESRADTFVHETMMHSKAELETYITTLNLVDENIIESVNTKSGCIKVLGEDAAKLRFLKRKIVCDIERILDEQIILLVNAIENEKCVYERFMKYDLFIFESGLNVWAEKSYFMSLSKSNELILKEEYEPVGIVCVIKYGDCVFSCSFYDKIKNNEKDLMERLKGYICEKEYEGKYKRGEIEIELKRNVEDSIEINDLKDVVNEKTCFNEFIVESIFRKLNMDRVFEYCMIYISKYTIKYFIKSLNLENKDFKEINFIGKKLVDNFTNTYFLINKNHKIKIKRGDNKFEMFYNGRYVDFSIQK